MKKRSAKKKRVCVLGGGGGHKLSFLPPLIQEYEALANRLGGLSLHGKSVVR